jgi:ribosomal protein S18 acetylase RimI-like enzyme
LANAASGKPAFAAVADAWLGKQLGKQSWRVDMRAGQGAPAASLAFAPGEFAYAKVPSENCGAVRDLIRVGFYPVDVAVTFEGPAQGASAQRADVRFACPEDRDAVAEIARTTFRYSRFHLDPLIPRGIANEMKAQWAANFFVGARGDAMVVAEADGVVVGFLQLLRQPNEMLLIDLIGVAPSHQGRGLARAMIGFASTHGAGEAAPRRLRVGTQIANTASVRLYESLGLRLADAQYVLHLHS